MLSSLVFEPAQRASSLGARVAAVPVLRSLFFLKQVQRLCAGSPYLTLPVEVRQRLPST